MVNEYPNTYSAESTAFNRNLICWKSAFAGLALAVLTFAGVLSLAIAFGGIGLDDGATVKSASIFSGVSLMVALILSAFIGSYFSVRVSKFRVDVMGVMQGLLVGALFLVVVLFQAMSGVGALGKVAGTALGASATMAGAGAAAASQSPMVQEIVEDNVGDLKLKSDGKEVVAGLASRLLRGDQESAKNYLAYQAGMSSAEADQKIAAAKVKIDEAMIQARQATATALKTVGWSLFLGIALSMIAAAMGGMSAALLNERYTMDAPDYRKKTVKV